MRNVQEMCGGSKGNVSVGKNLQKIRWNYQLLNSQTTSLNRWISLNILSSHLTLWFIQCHKNAICSKPSTLYDYVHPAVDVVATFFAVVIMTGLCWNVCSNACGTLFHQIASNVWTRFSAKVMVLDWLQTPNYCQIDFAGKMTLHFIGECIIELKPMLPYIAYTHSPCDSVALPERSHAISRFWLWITVSALASL